MKIRPKVEISDHMEYCENCIYKLNHSFFCNLYMTVLLGIGKREPGYETIKCYACKVDSCVAKQTSTNVSIIDLDTNKIRTFRFNGNTWDELDD